MFLFVHDSLDEIEVLVRVFLIRFGRLSLQSSKANMLAVFVGTDRHQFGGDICHVENHILFVVTDPVELVLIVSHLIDVKRFSDLHNFAKPDGLFPFCRTCRSSAPMLHWLFAMRRQRWMNRNCRMQGAAAFFKRRFDR